MTSSRFANLSCLASAVDTDVFCTAKSLTKVRASRISAPCWDATLRRSTDCCKSCKCCISLFSCCSAKRIRSCSRCRRTLLRRSLIYSSRWWRADSRCSRIDCTRPARAARCSAFSRVSYACCTARRDSMPMPLPRRRRHSRRFAASVDIALPEGVGSAGASMRRRCCSSSVARTSRPASRREMIMSKTGSYTLMVDLSPLRRNSTGGTSVALLTFSSSEQVVVLLVGRGLPRPAGGADACCLTCSRLWVD
ncbi:hypothetical protein NP493_51g04061 [Ridgeia piscesae]|uniref:Uncharacterized protein n=1 Tax=Ridgeia piscesae TaxID=27915 RepID=A0AAD9PBJ6_RIDPI|nr:hypothetical protein NP493_51g04061 [Ridgeia piscesae]